MEYLWRLPKALEYATAVRPAAVRCQLCHRVAAVTISNMRNDWQAAMSLLSSTGPCARLL